MARMIPRWIDDEAPASERMTRARALLILLIVDTTEARGVWEPRFQEIARRAAGDPDQTALGNATEPPTESGGSGISAP